MNQSQTLNKQTKFISKRQVATCDNIARSRQTVTVNGGSYSLYIAPVSKFRPRIETTYFRPEPPPASLNWSVGHQLVRPKTGKFRLRAHFRSRVTHSFLPTLGFNWL